MAETITVVGRTVEELTDFMRLAVKDDYLFICNRYLGLRVLYVPDPTDNDNYQTFVETYDSWFPSDFLVDGNYGYLASAEYLAQGDDEDPFYDYIPDEVWPLVDAGGDGYYSFIDVLDITDPTSISSVEQLWWGLGYAETITKRGDYLYIADGYTGLTILDVSNPLSLSVVGQVAADGDNWATTIAINKGLDVPVLANSITPTDDLSISVGSLDTATFVENPQKTGAGLVVPNFPNDDIPDTWARKPLDMLYFPEAGKIYLGAGDYNHNNRGETDVFAFDSSETFTLEGTIQEHEVNLFHIIDDDLWLPGIDAVVGTNGYYYTQDAVGAVTQSAAIGSKAHVYDIAKLGTDLYARVGLLSAATEIYKWNGVAWASLLADSPYLLALSDRVVMIGKDSGFASYWQYDGAVLTEHVVNMFPSYPYAWTRPTHMVEYSGTVLYAADFAEHQMAIATPLYRLDPGTHAVTTALDAYVVRDVIVRGAAIFAMTVEASGPNFVGRIHESTDFSSWSEIATFTVDAPPQSFEFMDGGNFYVSAGSGTYGNSYANSGGIYRIE